MDTSSPITLNGLDFSDLDGFYTVIYSMMNLYEDWKPAHNLDAFNDILYSGFGKEQVKLVWKHSAKSKSDLGLQATRNFYQHKIDQGQPYNTNWAAQQLDALNSGNGATLFDIIVEIFHSHRHIELVLL
jgi:RNAse (barnase) inhibitor barstar